MAAPALRLSGATDLRQSLSTKLKIARLSMTISTRTVAERLNRRFPISHATIANYEAGKFVPPLDVLAALAELYDRPLNWFLERGETLAGIRYRNLKSRVRASDLHRFEADVQRWIDAFVAIERRLKRHLKASVSGIDGPRDLGPGELSREVRRRLQISEAEPIPSVVEVLEAFGIRVLEHPTDLRIDGLAARYSGENVVVLNPMVSNDRVRMNAAHELAHVLFGDCDLTETDNKETERRAFEFASHGYDLSGRQAGIRHESRSKGPLGRVRPPRLEEQRTRLCQT
jgi:transcriptional regulator with XRE-family HTH domain